MKITHTVDIAASPSLVWTYLEDREKQKQWMHGVVDNHATSDGPTRPGSTFRMSIKEGRKVVEYNGEILAYVVDEHMQVRLTGGCLRSDMSMTADYRLSGGSSDGTRLDYTCTADLHGMWRLGAPFFKLMAGYQARRFIRSLRELAERETRTPMLAG